MARSAGTFSKNFPESFELVPFCCPSIEMETPDKGRSFSSKIIPLIVAGFFWAKQKLKENKVINRMIARKFTKQICLKNNRLDVILTIS